MFLKTGALYKNLKSIVTIPLAKGTSRPMESPSKNAIIKARHACAETNLPAMSDDSGLQVDALAGAPGVLSARYSGGDSIANYNKVLENLKGVPDSKRHASFHCVIVFMAHANDPVPLICEGVWQGKILTAPQGEGGFGYDPVFIQTGSDKTFAEISAEEKNRVSHRAAALRNFITDLKKYFTV